MKASEQIMTLMVYDDLDSLMRETCADIAETAYLEHEQFKKSVFDAIEFYGGNDEGCTANLILKKIQSLIESRSKP